MCQMCKVKETSFKKVSSSRSIAMDVTLKENFQAAAQLLAAFVVGRQARQEWAKEAPTGTKGKVQDKKK